MSVELLIRDPLGERALAAADFPLSVGGPGNTVSLASLPETPSAWVALHDGQLFLQPAEGGVRLLCNGLAVTHSTWLRDGDVVDAGTGRLRLRLRGDTRVVEIEDGSAGNLTLPPQPAGAEVVSGGGNDEDEAIEAVAFRHADGLDEPPRRPFKFAAGLLGAAVLGLVLWFLWAGRSIEVVTHPAAESVHVRGGFPVLPAGGRVFLRPGHYDLLVERKGYEPLRRAIVVSDATGQKFEFALQKLPGRLRVESPTAVVAIDGRAAGRAPGEFKLRPGRHVIALRADRYLPFEASVDIAGGDRRQVLRAKLVPAWATLEVLSEPSGAEVRVGGEPGGVTPLKLELGAGSHHVELRHAGYKDWVTDVQIVANQPQKLGPVRLGLPDARLVVRSNPPGANVSVGGAYRGRTPVEIDVPPEIALPIVIAKDGYESAVSSATLGPGESRALTLNLAPIFGELTVQATPSNAEVLSDGRSLGKAGQTYRLPAATHQIEVRAQGFHSYRVALTPRPGLPQVINVRLEEARGELAVVPGAAVATTAAASGNGDGSVTATAAAPPGPMSAAIRTKSGQELKLVPAGAYTMGSARRESGRRANESPRSVELRRRFYLATREVTNAEFRLFRPAHHSGFVGQNTLERDKQPVAGVSWQEAAAYCNWLSSQEGLPAAYESKAGRLVPVQPLNTGYRLPTEAEWEWAARANRDGTLRKYPWGDALPVPAGAGNFADRSSQPLQQLILDDYDDGNPVSAPVGSYAPNALGFYDLGGNVAEWSSDLYTVQPPGGALAVDPVATGDGKLYVIRGSSWRHATVTELRLAFRDYGEGGRDDVGLRIARYAE